MGQLTHNIEFFVLWDDHTWDDEHFHNVPMPDTGEEYECGGSMVLNAAQDYADQELMANAKYRKAVRLIAAFGADNIA